MNNYEFSARDGTGRVVGRLFYNFDAALLVPSANSHADYREGARPAAVDASARPLAALLEEQRSICERLERVERQLAAQRSAFASLRKRLSNRRGTDPPRRSEG
jgi:type VI protein secretion system component VasF